MEKQPKYRRILLKLSGEALSAKGQGILDFDFINSIADSLKKCLDAGVQIGIIVGAGNIWRGRQGGQMDRVRADSMGMLATTINALALQDTFISAGLDTKVMTAVEMETFADKYVTRNAVAALEDGKIVISAWMITHEHQDHYWCMYKTLLNHGDEIRVKKLYVTSLALSFISNGKFNGLDGLVQTPRLEEVYAKTEKFEVVRMHTGQKFNIRNVQIEVLYTLEDMFPEYVHEYCEFNDTTTVMRMSVDGGTFMNLGDAYKIASHVLCDMYGSALKSDICTVAHHGWGGCTVEVYDNVMPEMFMFPFSKKWFDRMMNMTTRINSKGEEVLWIQWAINRYGPFYEATHRTFDIVGRDLNKYLLADGCNKTVDLATRKVRNETVFNEQINYPY